MRGTMKGWTLAVAMTAICFAGAGDASAVEAQASRNEEMRLWDKQPADTPWKGPEETRPSDGPNNAKILVKTNVLEPTLTVVRPAAAKANGTGVIVAPGGAFMALAWDLEGIEIARWLADRGIVAFVLKYRVGPPKLKAGESPPTDVPGLLQMLEANRKLAVADASQAVRLVRSRAAEFGIASDRIGMIGFSAGAMTTMGVVLEGGHDARPDFVAPIYGLLASTAAVPSDAPPAFIAAAADDPTVPASGSIDIFEKWTAAKRPAELHVYEKGGHGFGMRPRNIPVDYWPAAFEAWLREHRLLGQQGAKASGAAE